MKRTFSLILLSLLFTHLAGKTPSRGDSAEVCICYNVDSVVRVLKAQGKQLPLMMEWLSEQNSHFNGSTEAWQRDISIYSNNGSAFDNTQAGGDGYTNIFQPNSQQPFAPVYRGRKDYQYGAWVFGPSYRRGSIVWFVNGRFLFVTGCKARVKFDYTAPRFYVAKDLPVGIEYIGKIEIVEGDKNFRQYIPHLKSWRGKTPTLIFLTTKAKARQMEQ